MVDGLIGAFIEDLKALKKRHRDHVHKLTENHQPFAALAQKVINGEPLELSEATGNSFAKMLDSANEQPGTESPYRVESEQLHAELLNVIEKVNALLTRVELFWKST